MHRQSKILNEGGIDILAGTLPPPSSGPPPGWISLGSAVADLVDKLAGCGAIDRPQERRIPRPVSIDQMHEGQRRQAP